MPTSHASAGRWTKSDSLDDDALRDLEYDTQGYGILGRDPPGAPTPDARWPLPPGAGGPWPPRSSPAGACQRGGALAAALDRWPAPGGRPEERGGPRAPGGPSRPRASGDLGPAPPAGTVPAARPSGGGVAAAAARDTHAARTPQGPTALWCATSTQGWAAAAREACLRLPPHGPSAAGGGPHADFPTVGKLTRWLAARALAGGVAPPAVVLLGWREAKPCLRCMDAVAAECAGRAGDKRQAGARQAPAGGASVAVVLAEGEQQRARAASFVASRERATGSDCPMGPRALVAGSADELWDLLHAVAPVALARPAMAGGPGAPSSWTREDDPAGKSAAVIMQVLSL
ncbi:unnamed protein product [Prorocentrum cordatum]|uniref:Uncharacterized protein n=1 Tax=Prorocentrum cordatum TaxID=2364126 RepID=A0ABN9XAU2_9DINO|nr:unnamed protein product [Polarella glacialis]